MSQAIVQRNTGGMNKDSDKAYVNNGDYIDANNVRVAPDIDGTGDRHTIIKGNKYAFRCGSVSAQNKEFLISGINGGNYLIQFYHSNGFNFGDSGAFSDRATLISNINVLFDSSIFRVDTALVGSDSVRITVSIKDPANPSLPAFDIKGFDMIMLSAGADDLSITVVSEAYDLSMEGKLQPIGSVDILSDLWIFSTSNPTEQSEYPLYDLPITSYGVDPEIVIDFSPSACPFETGKYVLIQNSGDALLDGVHLVRVTGANTMVLCGTAFYFVGVSTGGTISYASIGVGAIGVAQKNLDLDSWTYTELIRSKEFNFSKKYPIDVVGEKDQYRTSLYWTDNNNPWRCMYYTGGYVQGGFLEYNNSQNTYAYGTIGEAISLQVSTTGVSISLSSQTSGGNLPCGTYRYAVRFVSESLSTTPWSDLSNPVFVYFNNKTSPQNYSRGIYGGLSTENTEKINVISVSCNNFSIFKYVELCYIYQSSDSSFAGYILERKSISNGDTEILFNHSGYEQNLTALDIGTISDQQAASVYLTSKNIDVINNRLVLSNIKLSSQYDLSEYFSLWTHSLKKKSINIGGSVGGWSFDDYRDVENPNLYMSYMIRERYRFYARAKVKGSGAVIGPFYIDDIVFDCNGSGTYPRRIAGLDNYNLSNSHGDVIYSPYVEFHPWTFDYKVNGVKIKDVIDEIYIDRVELDDSNRQVLFAGVAPLCVQNGTLGLQNEVYLGDAYRIRWAIPDAPYTPPHGVNIDNDIIGEYLFYGGMPAAFWDTAATNPQYPGLDVSGTGDSFSQRRDCFSIYSPDIYLGGKRIEFKTGDVIINFGHNPSSYYRYTYHATYPTTYSNTLTNIPWYNNLDDSGSTPQELTIVDIGYSDKDTFPIIDGEKFSKALHYVRDASALSFFFKANAPGYFIKCGSNAINPQSSGDYDLPMSCIYFRGITSSEQYGDIYTSSKIIPTGASIVNISSLPATSVDVFGGDVFINRNSIKSRENVIDGFAANVTPSYPPTQENGTVHFDNIGVSFISPSYINSGLRSKTTKDLYAYPYVSAPVWLDRMDRETYEFNSGYNSKTILGYWRAFDPSISTFSSLPATIVYSDIKAQGSLQDNYRTILPLNRKDLDLTFGEIVSHMNFNGELITVQNRKFMRQYFNTTGVLSTTEGSEVILGDGAVLSRRGQTLSTYGSRHKWSVIKGRTQGGNDCLYFVDIENLVIVRFGADGLTPISVRAKIDSFVRNGIKWASGKDNPLDTGGINGVWNERFDEMILSVRGNRYVSPWEDGVDYAAGEVVSYTPTTFSTFEQTGEIYVAYDGALAGQNPQDNPGVWTLIPHTDKDYYSEFTLVWSEDRNKFVTFHRPIPKLYMKWNDTYLTPSPVAVNSIDVDMVYEHNTGNWCSWYDGELTDTAHIQGVVNYDPESIKTAEAIRVDSVVAPFFVEIDSANHHTEMDNVDFEGREGNYDAAIKNDMTTTLNPEADGGKVFGRWITAKIVMESGVYQSVRSFIMKVRNRAREYRR